MTPLSSSVFHNSVLSVLTYTTSPKNLTIIPFTVVMALMKLMDLLEMVAEAWLSIPITKESESTRNFCGMLQTYGGLADDGAGKAVQMTLRLRMLFREFLPMWSVHPICLGLMYFLH